MSGTRALRAGVRETRPKYDNTKFLKKKGGQLHDDDGVGEEVPEPPDDDGVGEEVPEAGGEDDERDDDKDAVDPRHDIQARLRRSPNVIVADTWANRPQRTRATIDKYRAGTRTATKKPGRGRGR